MYSFIHIYMHTYTRTLIFAQVYMVCISFTCICSLCIVYIVCISFQTFIPYLYCTLPPSLALFPPLSPLPPLSLNYIFLFKKRAMKSFPAAILLLKCCCYVFPVLLLYSAFKQIHKYLGLPSSHIANISKVTNISVCTFPFPCGYIHPSLEVPCPIFQD